VDEISCTNITQLQNADGVLYNIVWKLSNQTKKIVQRAGNKKDGLLQIRNERLHTHTHTQIYIYTGCPRRNVPDFGRVFLMLKYTDITQNTYIQIWTVTEIMAREVWNFDSCYTLIDYQILVHIKTGRNMWFL